MRRCAVIVRCGWGAAVGVCVLVILAIPGGQDHPPLSPETQPSSASQAPRLPAYPLGLLPPGPEFYAGLGDSPAADAPRGQSVVTAEARAPVMRGNLDVVVPAAGLAPSAPPPPSAPILPGSPPDAAMPIAPAAPPSQAGISPLPAPPAPLVAPTPVVTASAVIGRRPRPWCRSRPWPRCRTRRRRFLPRASRRPSTGSRLPYSCPRTPRLRLCPHRPLPPSRRFRGADRASTLIEAGGLVACCANARTDSSKQACGFPAADAADSPGEPIGIANAFGFTIFERRAWSGYSLWPGEHGVLPVGWMRPR